MEKLNIYLVHVTIEFTRNRKTTTRVFDSRITTKGNDFATRLKFLKFHRFCKEFKPGIDRVTKIETVKKVGETSVVNN